jgi:hypothetical protein
MKLNLQNPNPYLADSRNRMHIKKVEHDSKIVWLASWLNKVGQPTGGQFSTLKLAKQRANEIGIPFEVSKVLWRSI